jgi:PAS domain S-box-containing protein
MDARRRSVPEFTSIENLGVGSRLQATFACVLLIMLVGSVISFWDLRNVGNRVAAVSTTEQRLAAILRVNNGLLMLTNRLHRAAEGRDPGHFRAEAQKLLLAFQTETRESRATLGEIAPANGREKFIVDSLSEVVEDLPERVATLRDLAGAGDWVALNARLANQLDHTDDVAEALMREADSELSQVRRRVFEDISHAEYQAGRTLAITAILSFLIASILGLVVTRSITRPLSTLGAGARALAEGGFKYRVTMSGMNELTTLAAVFNQTAGKLDDLYARLRASEARFRSLIENASDLILLISETGEFIYASPSSYSVLGYSPDLLVGRSIREFILPEEESVADHLFSNKNLALNNHHRFELYLRHNDGSLRLLDGIVTNLLSDPAVAGILINARDMSERRKAELALENTNEALRRANDDLSVFAYCASHDLQEPIRNVSLYCQMLQRNYSGRLDSQADEFIGHMIEGSARMSGLVKDLLAYLHVSNSRAHSTSRLVPVEFAIAQALSNLESSIRSTDATVVYDDLPSVPAEPVHLQQLFQNLISNAIKYRSAEAPHVRISARAVNGYWCFSVKDNGIGISPQYTGSVFRLFKRLHGRGEYPGTGVGLAICQKIVERHGGRIWVESQPGVGSDFRFTFPQGQQSPTTTI